MKRLFAVALVMMLIAANAGMAEIDLSGMTYDELVALKDKINKAMWECEEWQEVTVPRGVWEVGVDIPAGHWTIRPEEKSFAVLIIGNFRKGATVDGSKSYVDVAAKDWEYYTDDYMQQADVILENGHFVEVSADAGNAVFTPYSGKPDLGFK